MGEFGKNFESLQQLLEGVTALATANRASYNAHITAGFSKPEAMQLTIALQEVAVRSMFEMAMQQGQSQEESK